MSLHNKYTSSILNPHFCSVFKIDEIYQLWLTARLVQEKHIQYWELNRHLE
jgi:hypothetical protein